MTTAESSDSMTDTLSAINIEQLTSSAMGAFGHSVPGLFGPNEQNTGSLIYINRGHTSLHVGITRIKKKKTLLQCISCICILYVFAFHSDLYNQHFIFILIHVTSTIIKSHKCSIIVTASKMDREINFSEIELCISSRIVTALFGVQVV